MGTTALASGLGGSRAFGQTTKEPRRIALLTVSSEANFASSLQAVRDGLRERGHVEARDIVIDIRYADGRAQELARLAAELAALEPAVIVAPGAPATDAALAATASDAAAESARWLTSFSRWLSPPDSVLMGCPRRR